MCALPRQPFLTPRAIQVFATASQLAGSRDQVSEHHLLLSLEAVESVGSQALRTLDISLAASLGRAVVAVPLDLAFDNSEQVLAGANERIMALAFAEAKEMGVHYVGTEHLLLALARLGVAGSDLPFEGIRRTINRLLADA